MKSFNKLEKTKPSPMQRGKIFYSVVFLLFTFSQNSYCQTLSQQEKWNVKLEAYQKKDLFSPPPDSIILFLGSSTIAGWRLLEADYSPEKVVNRGISGTKMIDIYNFREKLIKPYNPKKVFIYEGDNDIALGWTPDSIYNVFQQLFRYIREQKPGATIYVMSIKASPSREKYKDALLRTNELMRAFLKTQDNAEYIDMYFPMLNKKNGDYIEEYYKQDNLHLTEKGYECWDKIIKPYIKN